ncbi:MAG: DNA gyrase subunit A [Bacteroidota bacterium]
MADDKIIPINIEEEMKTAYIDYSMSVIVSRAIPDVRDGLKPVHRRVLYGMHDLGLYYNKPHKKSARIVGEVLGKYHPHGDSSVYDAMVRMAQEWSLRYPLVDGQGNFGSVDGDSPAAMRYTEARQAKITEEILKDIDKETVDFNLNFDDTLEEPSVLPSRIPTLLVNGASGIAVGMATNILPHNLSEVIDGMLAYVDNHDITIDELIKFVKAPDFPTGGTIYGYAGVKEAFETGRGKIVVRGTASIEVDEKGRENIIITEIPYQVNKAVLIQKIAELVNDKKIEGVSDIRDESDRDGMRIVVDIKRDGAANVVLNQLYTFTQLQTSYGVNNVALVHGRPYTLNLYDMIKHFIEFRHDVVIRRTQYDLKDAEKRAHILEGLLIALDNLDEVISLIRSSATVDIAKEGLISKFALSEIQAKAILDLRLQKLTSLESEKIREEHKEIMKLIESLKEILANRDLRMQIIKDELVEVKTKFGDARKTQIEYAGGDINMEDLIESEEVVITISHLGYIKRTSLNEFKSQNRGGTGSKGASTRNEDFTEHLLLANTHNYMLFFTTSGKCLWLKVYEIPEGNKGGKGRAIQNIMNLPAEDKIMAYMPVKNLKDEEYLNNHYVMFCTKLGVIKKTLLEEFSRPRQNGIQAITIREDDQLLEAILTNGKYEVLLAKRSGKAIRFNESKVRASGRTSMGVTGVELESSNDEVIGMVCVNPEDKGRTIMVVSEKGFGKRTFLDDPETGENNYRVTNRGGKGVKTLNITEKTGDLIAIKDVTEEDHLMIINKSGITIRIALKNIRTAGRATQGVTLIKLKDNDEIAAVAKIENGESLESDAAELLENEEISIDSSLPIENSDNINESPNEDSISNEPVEPEN